MGLSARLAVRGWGGGEGQGTRSLPGGLPVLVPSLTTRTSNLLQLNTGRAGLLGGKGSPSPHPGSLLSAILALPSPTSGWEVRSSGSS